MHRSAASRTPAWGPVAFAPLAFALLLLRRPAALLHADFWAEDGWRWYPDAYARGWRTLLEPYAGYLQTICRLVGLAAQPFPLAWAPTIFSLSAMAIQVAAATFLLSSRLDHAWPHRASRVVFAWLYLLLPNSFEVHANLTNAQWHLSLLAFLLLAARPAASLRGAVADLAVLALCGLSGPFCLFLLPVAAWQAWARRAPDSRRKLALVALCCIVQAVLVIQSGRGAAPLLDAGPRRLAAIVALQVIMGVEAGRHSMNGFIHTRLWLDSTIPLLVSGAAMLLAGLALWRGGSLLRQFVLFAALAFAAGMLRPAITSTSEPWAAFATPDTGDRYYLLPMLAWIGVLFSLAASREVVARGVAYGLIAMVLLAIPGDLHFATRLAAPSHTDFVTRARMFANAPPGRSMQFPLRPQGAPPMLLTKR